MCIEIPDLQRIAAAKLDPRDFEIAVLRAKADVAEAEAVARSNRSEVALTETNSRGQISHADRAGYHRCLRCRWSRTL